MISNIKTIRKKQIIISFLCMSYTVFSQETINIQYLEQQTDTLINQYKLYNKNNTISVYRIQLESASSPEKIKKIKTKYLKAFPLESVEEIFESPHFKAITGIYSDKKNAEKKLQNIKRIFRSAFIFQEKISMDIFKQKRDTITL